jgi:uncharacterized protein YceK
MTRQSVMDGCGSIIHLTAKERAAFVSALRPPHG